MLVVKAVMNLKNLCPPFLWTLFRRLWASVYIRLFTSGTIRYRPGSVAVELDIRPEAGLLGPDLAWSIVRQNYEKAEVLLVEKVGKKGDRVLEIGGGIGAVSSVIGKLVGPNGDLLVIEPNSQAISRAKRNLELNCIEARILHGAFSANRSLAFSSGQNVLSGRTTASLEGGCDLPLYSLEDIILSEDFTPDLIVCDAEGAEYELLASDLLESVRPRIVVEIHPDIMGPDRHQWLLRRLHCLGYAVRDVTPTGRHYNVACVPVSGAIASGSRKRG